VKIFQILPRKGFQEFFGGATEARRTAKKIKESTNKKVKICLYEITRKNPKEQILNLLNHNIEPEIIETI